jgi:hypothetical protein
MLVALGGRAHAQDNEEAEAATPEAAPEAAPAAATEAASAPPAAPPPAPVRYYPPPVSGPALRVPDLPTRIYLDGAYAESKDLSALPYIAGRGRNYRVALGGTLRHGRFTFEGEAFANVTTIDVDEVLNMPRSTWANPADAHQTNVSLGDLALGASWIAPLVDSGALLGGFGLRARIPTHTTQFQFHLADGSIAIFTIPYYFHAEPTAILAGALGPFTFVMNQGAIVLSGPDGDLDGNHIVVPNIYLWDAHYAVGVTPLSELGLSVEFATDIQLNHVPGVDYEKFNNVRAAWIAPAVQIHVDDWQIDLIARIGLTRGQELYGVLEYVGTSSYTVRVGRNFN